MTQASGAARGKLGIIRLLGLHYYVLDLERSRRFYTELMGFDEIGKSSPELEQAGKQRSLVFQAGDVVVTCSTPLGEGGRAYRYLRTHPDGIGTLAFEVEDIERAFTLLDRAGGTPISEVQRVSDDRGQIATFSITTPFGDTTFRFIERHAYRGLFPGMETYATPRGGHNQHGLVAIDHITSNFQTMSPALLWLEHVLGFEAFWEIEFHTKDVVVTGRGTRPSRPAGGAVGDPPSREVASLLDATTPTHGSGLRSKVMWEPGSGIKFANNEPYRPAFKESQINLFHRDNHGDGIQHAALATRDIVATVRALRARGLRFMPTPDTYYAQLPDRLRALGIAALDEEIGTLRELQILVDGSGPGAYLLQIFLADSAELYGTPEAGPFFFELIQRKGDRGFGGGNFRALFESIERQQSTAREPGALGEQDEQDEKESG
ncbi:MAG TPA: VOC family protein [Polyangiales bacterium]|nr:VOC family protein [Polyangiales bacterium]